MRWPSKKLVFLLLACLGCGSKPIADQQPAPVEIRRRELASLPEVSDYAPPIDDGRLQAAPPTDWSIMPPGRTYLMGFSAGRGNELPRIVINADDPPSDRPTDLTDETAAEFAAHQDTDLQSAAKAGRKRIEEYNLPLVLGETVFIRHVRQAVLGDKQCVVQSLQTIKSGRLYTVELIVAIEAPKSDGYEQSLMKWRDQGYAVAAHLKFAPPGGTLFPPKKQPAKKEATQKEPAKNETPKKEAKPPEG